MEVARTNADLENDLPPLPAKDPIQNFRNIFRLNDPEAKKRNVYFLYCAGHMKIGITNKVERRMSELQIGSPWATQIVLLIPGGRATEGFLHFAFREERVGGEWFRMSPFIREAIHELAPEECAQWLAQEEASYRQWVADEAAWLGLLPGGEA